MTKCTVEIEIAMCFITEMLGAKNSEISIFYFTKLNNYDNDNYRMMQQSTTYHCIFENYVIVLTSDQACNFFFFFPTVQIQYRDFGYP